MNCRRRDRTSRAAAVIAVNGRSIMNDQVARAMAALAEMRRRASGLTTQNRLNPSLHSILAEFPTSCAWCFSPSFLFASMFHGLRSRR